MDRYVCRCLSALVLAAAAPAAADTAVVPTDFATIQEAVDAVQGTANPLVVIQSDATFTETVVVTESVTIEAGGGFTPSLQGTTGSCIFLGGCAVLFNPNGAVPTNFVLSGLRFLPAAGASPGSGHRILQMLNEGSALSFLTGEVLTFEDPGSTGANLFSGRVGTLATGENRIVLRQITATIGSTPGFGTRAFAIEDEGRLTLEDVHLVLGAGAGQGFLARGTRGDGVTLELRDSFFDVAADDGFTSHIGVVISLVSATIERNRFLLRGGAGPGAAQGISLVTGTSPDPESQELVLDANEFAGVGSAGTAVLAEPFPGGTSSVIATNNVVRELAGGFLASPQNDSGSQTGGRAILWLVNNTVHDSTGSAVRLEPQPFTTVELSLFNNLLTGSGGLGVDVAPGSGSLAWLISHNGYFANALGDIAPPLTDPEPVFGDPLYLGAGDLRLRTSSPMLDAGDNRAPMITPLDFTQRPRIQNGTVDLGAYEGAFAGSVIEVPTLGSPLLVLLAALLAVLAVRRLSSPRHSPSRSTAAAEPEGRPAAEGRRLGGGVPRDSLARGGGLEQPPST